MLKHALALARRGLHVFPCRPRAKEPATTNGCKDATRGHDVIEGWWRQNPDFNIGIATGPNSHIFVLDVDGIDAEVELKNLEAQYGRLPATVEAITGDGRHVFFEWADDQPVRNSAGKLGPGLDIRGTAGYIVAPPSIHPTGRRYCWSVDSAKDFARAPVWLLDKISAPANGKTIPATPPSEWRALICAIVGEGQRNDTITRLAGYLLRYGIDPVVTLQFLMDWNRAHCRLPLEDIEVATIVHSIFARELKRRGVR
jgi:hypothetical protein